MQWCHSVSRSAATLWGPSSPSLPIVCVVVCTSRRLYSKIEEMLGGDAFHSCEITIFDSGEEASANLSEGAELLISGIDTAETLHMTRVDSGRSLERKDEALDENALLEVLRQVDADHAISTLKLVNVGLSPSLAVQLADFLEKNASLTHVDLSGNDRMGAHGVSCLAESLSKNSTLRTLALSRCKLSGDALVAWTQFFRNGDNSSLQTIDLSDNQIRDDGAEHIAVMLEEARTRGLSLDLRSNELSDASLQQFSDALKIPHPFVVGIRLENNQDEDDAAIYRQRIEYYLKRNRALLKRVSLMDRIKLIAESSVEVCTCHIDHETLSLADADALSAALRSNVSITSLRLQDNGLPMEATRRISMAIRGNRSITALSLVDNNIGDIGFQALSSTLRAPSALRSLQVANSIHLSTQSGLAVMAPRTASALHYTFANFSMVTTVALSNCALDDRLVGAIISGMAWSARIESLALSNNLISDHSVHVFVNLIRRCQLLRHLDLSSNRFTLRGLLPLSVTASTHRRLRSLLLGRFPDYDASLIDGELLPQFKQSVSLVRIELATVVKRSRTAESVAALNAELASRHTGEAETERQTRVLQEQAHEHRCFSLALVRHAAHTFTRQLLASAGQAT